MRREKTYVLTAAQLWMFVWVPPALGIGLGLGVPWLLQWMFPFPTVLN